MAKESKKETLKPIQRIIDNFWNDDVVIIKKDSYKFKR